MHNSGILLLARDGPSTRIIHNALRAEFGALNVILEDRQSRARLAWRRTRRLGALTVMGQIALILLLRPLLSWNDRKRVREIKQQFNLNDSPIDEPVFRVPSVNSDAARVAIAQFQPALIVVSGTRILDRETLRDIRCPIINIHCGITPLYRGVHGGYWALAEGHPELVGTTIHYIDAGIDTGPIIDQSTFQVSSADSLATYPYLHTAAGLLPLVKAVRDALAGHPPPSQHASELPSRLRFHPTLWGYLRRRVQHGTR